MCSGCAHLRRCPNWWSAARQPGKPLPGILDFGKAGVGGFPQAKELAVAFSRLGLQALLLVQEAQPVMAFRMDEELILVLRVEGKNGNVLLNYETVR